jgi:hypothetical protein
MLIIKDTGNLQYKEMEKIQQVGTNQNKFGEIILVSPQKPL